MQHPLAIVVCGPIASGKSTLARAVARTLNDRGVAAVAIDLDLVYEMLVPGAKAKDEAPTWSRTRRIAARMADALFESDVEAVVLEGDFLAPDERAELVAALEPERRVRYVTLEVPLADALVRVAADPSRGLSRDAAFLARHYEEIGPLLRGRPESDLGLDTSGVSVDDAADAVVAWALAATRPRA